jgi:hypothetical protein
MRNKPEKEENKNESKKKKILPFTGDFVNIYHSYGFFGFSSIYIFL